MKRILIFLLISFTIQNSLGQVSGTYKINYIANIISGSKKVEKIGLPTIQYLHGLEDEKSQRAFFETKPMNNRIDIILDSDLTYHIYNKPKNLLRLYQTKREYLPILITLKAKGQSLQIRQKLYWDDIQIIKLKSDEFGNVFELNLNDIIINQQDINKNIPMVINEAVNP